MITLLYLIEILHQTTTAASTLLTYFSCILLKFYIKPQLAWIRSYSAIRCILLKFYIKPQQAAVFPVWQVSCILLKFYIKPQQQGLRPCDQHVVSYWNSTSNHNWTVRCFFRHYVVSYWNSTSNHNNPVEYEELTGLYLIEILHQTTTWIYCQ